MVQAQKNLPSYSLFNTTNLDDVRDSILSSRDDFVAVDTETTGLDWTIDRAFGVSLAWDDYGIFIRNTDFGADNIGRLMNALFSSTEKTFVFHNAEFDLHMMKVTYGTNFPISLLDTMRLSYVDNPSSKHGLKELGEIVFGSAAGAAEDVIKEYLHKYRLKGYHQVPSEFMDPYAVLDTVLTKALAHIYMDVPRSSEERQITKIEHDLIPVIFKMEDIGIRINTEYVNTLIKEYRVEQRAIQDKLYQIVGFPLEVNSNQQLASYLYDTLKIKPAKLTETGQRSVDSKTLEKIKHPVGTPVVELVLRNRNLTKWSSTFLEPYKDIQGRIHPHWNAMGAGTGRFSSSSPNMQNVPKTLRRTFIPDNEFFDFDYSQIELRIASSLSNQRNMVQAFKDGEDLHATTASLVFQKELNEVTKEDRRIGKTLNFATLYGAGVGKLSGDLELSKAQAGVLLNHLHTAYPQLKAQTYYCKLAAERDGYIETAFKRKLPIEAGEEFKAFNYMIQGTAADLMKLTLLRTAEYVESVGGTITNCVHDEIVFDNLEETAIKDLRQIMENFTLKGDVPVVVDFQRSKESWGDLIDG